MSLTIPEAELARELTAFAAVALAYPDELSRTHEALSRGLPVLIECDKGLTPYFYRCVRDRVKAEGLAALYLDGRPTGEGPPQSMVSTMIDQLRNAVRGAVDRRLVVLPHLDLVTTSSAGLTGEAKEVIPLMYENPNVLWLGFIDPSFVVPKVIEDLFPHRISILGVPRGRLRHLVTQSEARKLGTDGFQPFRLYPYVSGINAVRLRSVLEALRGEDYPSDLTAVHTQLRNATLATDLTLPSVDLERDIGGYATVKRRIERDILSIIERKSTLDDEAAVKRAESLIPRGIIFSGPPGTGKTLFAKAMATALGAAVQIVSGPELKSRWVGESEARLRRLFVKARQSAPAIIVFDELDSFAAARGTYTGSGVEHSMVNQLLTEMDGFRSNEMVFVVGTTNFLESIDPALLRPGRFELHIDVPYPNTEDREAILRIYDGKFALRMTDDAIEYAVRRSAAPFDEGGRTTGDHLNALTRALARHRLRERVDGPTTVMDVDRALIDGMDRPLLNAEEERVVATHEAGHAIVALHCEHAPPIDRISIRGDLAGSLGTVSYSDPANRYVVRRAELIDRMAILFGGREAELAVLGDLSLGAAHDLAQATALARSAVETYGMSEEIVVRDFSDPHHSALSDATRSQIDKAVERLLEQQRERARTIVNDHRATMLALRDELLTHKVIDRKKLTSLRNET